MGHDATAVVAGEALANTVSVGYVHYIPMARPNSEVTYHSITVPNWLEEWLQSRKPPIPYSHLATVAFGEAIFDDMDEDSKTRIRQLRRRTKEVMDMACKGKKKGKGR